MDLDNCNFLIWGYKNVYHTHSHIHEGFYRALKYLGKTVSWMDETFDLSDYELSNTIVITNHECLYDSGYWPWELKKKSKLPIKDDCFYVVHGLNDHRETRQIFEGKKNYLSWNVFHDFSSKFESIHGISLTETIMLAEDTPFYPLQKHLEFRWATDIMPSEIESLKPTDLLSLRDKKINWVGTIWNVNQEELGLFKKACNEDGVEFVHIGAGQRGVVSIEDNIKLVRNSYMAPAISGSHHITEGYAPCRIFKNISYGQFGITNSKRVNDIFRGRLIYNPNPYYLYYEAKEKLQSSGLSDLHSLMDFVSENHTYLNRIKSVIDSIKILK